MTQILQSALVNIIHICLKITPNGILDSSNNNFSKEIYRLCQIACVFFRIRVLFIHICTQSCILLYTRVRESAAGWLPARPYIYDHFPCFRHDTADNGTFSPTDISMTVFVYLRNSAWSLMLWSLTLRFIF